MRQRLVLRREEPTGITAPITCPSYVHADPSRVSQGPPGIPHRRSE